MSWFIYILRCKDGSLYTGITTDPERRLAEHKKGIGAKYTKQKGVENMVYLERSENRSMATKRENQIKKMSKVEKEKLSTVWRNISD